MNGLILPISVVDGSPVCSRCGMAYGLWALTVKYESDIPVDKNFDHRPGCTWKVPDKPDTKDFGPMLRQADLIPRNSNLIRMH